MQRLEVSCAVRLIYKSLGAKGLKDAKIHIYFMYRPTIKFVSEKKYSIKTFLI
jgi:hypothetical protein